MAPFAPLPSPNSHEIETGLDQLSSAAAEKIRLPPEGSENALKRGPEPSKPATREPLTSRKPASPSPWPSAATSPIPRLASVTLVAPRSCCCQVPPASRCAPRTTAPTLPLPARQAVSGVPSAAIATSGVASPEPALPTGSRAAQAPAPLRTLPAIVPPDCQMTASPSSRLARSTQPKVVDGHPAGVRSGAVPGTVIGAVQAPASRSELRTEPSLSPQATVNGAEPGRAATPRPVGGAAVLLTSSGVPHVPPGERTWARTHGTAVTLPQSPGAAATALPSGATATLAGWLLSDRSCGGSKASVPAGLTAVWSEPSPELQ